MELSDALNTSSRDRALTKRPDGTLWRSEYSSLETMRRPRGPIFEKDEPDGKCLTFVSPSCLPGKNPALINLSAFEAAMMNRLRQARVLPCLSQDDEDLLFGPARYEASKMRENNAHGIVGRVSDRRAIACAARLVAEPLCGGVE